MALGETASLSLSISDADPSGPPAVPQVVGLEVRYVGPSTEMTIVQGVVSSKTTYNFTVQPRRMGTFVIPSMRVSAGGQTLVSQPLQLRVLSAAAAAAAAQNASAGLQLAFVQLALPKTNVFAGEVIVAELLLYIRQGVQGVQNFQITEFPANGFNIGKMVEGQRRQVQASNAIYTVIPLRLPLTAVTPGDATVGPLAASVTAQVPARGQRRDPFFEQFGMRSPFDAFGGVEEKQVPLATAPQRVRIEALPTNNVPPTFSGAVGSFVMDASVGPTNVATGDPITLKVQISGRGALDSVNLPEQPSWSGFKVYPPIVKTETSDPMGLEGNRNFEQVVVPQTADTTALPSFSFSFFDPDARAFRTLTHPAVALVVRPGGAMPAMPLTPNAMEPASTSRDIVHIKSRLGVMAQIGVPVFMKGWFLALQAVPLAALAGALAWRARADKLERNPRLRRSRQAEAAIQSGLAELRKAAQEGNHQVFHATVFRLLQERIGERLDLPSAAITDAVVEEQLRPRGFSEPVLDEVTALFEACNVARYAAAEQGGAMAERVPHVESVLSRLKEAVL